MNRSRLAAIALQRCPRCREGRLFRGLMTMHESCGHCRLVFEREPGYFTGAMVVSYAMGVIAYAAMGLGLWRWTGWPLDVAFGVAILPFVSIAPVIVRWSRILWLHFDQVVDPA